MTERQATNLQVIAGEAVAGSALGVCLSGSSDLLLQLDPLLLQTLDLAQQHLVLAPELLLTEEAVVLEHLQVVQRTRLQPQSLAEVLVLLEDLTGNRFHHTWICVFIELYSFK